MMKKDHSWLRSYSEILTGKKVLELGCGPGIDTGVISQHASFVVAADLSPEVGPENSVICLDHSKTLPFAEDSFDVVVASLCLHYFSLQQTREIVAEIARVIKRNGYFICRVNSDRDTNYGAEGYPQIEPGYYAVNGESKRFFNEREIRTLCENDFRLEKLNHKCIDRYEKTKRVYEFSATRL